jgi:hypothetical protein
MYTTRNSSGAFALLLHLDQRWAIIFTRGPDETILMRPWAGGPRDDNSGLQERLNSYQLLVLLSYHL